MWVPDPEYKFIQRNIPILCVDLIVKNREGKLLMLKRENEPAQGEWWFPGGRVYHGETRLDAAVRKLQEECGLSAAQINEWKTMDVFLKNTAENYLSHAVSTFFLINVSVTSIKLDSQSSMAHWASIAEWQTEISNPIINNILTEIK